MGLEQTTYNADKGVEEKNFVVRRRSLVQRGREAASDGRPSMPLSTVVMQAGAVTTHRVSAADLARLGAHFGSAVLVVTGDSDIIVHPHNSKVLMAGLKGTLLVLPMAGHGANEQCAEQM